MFFYVSKPTKAQVDAYCDYYAPVAKEVESDYLRSYVFQLIPIVIFFLMTYTPNFVRKIESFLATGSLIFGVIYLLFFIICLGFILFMSKALSLLMEDENSLSEHQKKIKDTVLEKVSISNFKENKKSLNRVVSSYIFSFGLGSVLTILSFLSIYAVLPNSYVWLTVSMFILFFIVHYSVTMYFRLEILAINKQFVDKVRKID